MSEVKISELTEVTGTPDNGSLLELSEFDGIDSYESKKITLAALVALINNVDSGTYTPTVAGSVNITSVTAYVCSYMKVGNIVTVAGRVDVDPTSTGNTQFEMTLPIASDFTNQNQCAGTCNIFSGSTSNDTIYAIMANSSSNRALFAGASKLSTPDYFYFIFQYQIL